MTSLRIDCSQVVRRRQKSAILLRDLQRFVTVSGSSHENGREHEVVWIFRIECESFLRVSVALDQIAFRVPVDSEIAIGEGERKFRD